MYLAIDELCNHHWYATGSLDSSYLLNSDGKYHPFTKIFTIRVMTLTIVITRHLLGQVLLKCRNDN